MPLTAYLGRHIISGWENINKVITKCKWTPNSYIHTHACSQFITTSAFVLVKTKIWSKCRELVLSFRGKLPATHTHTHTHTHTALIRWFSVNKFQYQLGDSSSSQRSHWPPLIKRQRRPMSAARDKNKWWASCTFISCMKWNTALFSKHTAAAATGPLKSYQGQVHFQMGRQAEAAGTKWTSDSRAVWLVCY